MVSTVGMAKMKIGLDSDLGARYFLLTVLCIYFFVCELALLTVPFPGRKGLREKKLLLLMAILGSHLVFALLLFCEWDKRQQILVQQSKNNSENRHIGTADTSKTGFQEIPSTGAIEELTEYCEEKLEVIRQGPSAAAAVAVEDCKGEELEPRAAIVETLAVLKKERAKYQEERREWELQRSNLEEELHAVRKCAELYRGVLHDYHWFCAKDD